jgi:predicted nucleic acid-binding protein
VIIIESSAMVDALVGDPANRELLALLSDHDLHAPALIDYEVASVLRGHALGGKVTDSQIEAATADFTALRIERYGLTSMMPAVLALRENFTVYDAAYVVLAQVLESPLITADSKLLEARRYGVDVQLMQPGSG